MKLDNIGMTELPQDAYLSVGALSIYIVLKSKENFFKSIDIPCKFFLNLPDIPISPTPYFLKPFKSLFDMGFYIILFVFHQNYFLIKIEKHFHLSYYSIFIYFLG